MRLVDATYDADEWVLLPRKINDVMAVKMQDIGWIPTSHGILKTIIAAAPIHPSIRDHVEDEWISVNDKLPEDRGARYKILAVCTKKIESKDVDSPYFNMGIIGVYQDWNIRTWPHNFTHWMPLPLPPKDKP